VRRVEFNARLTGRTFQAPAVFHGVPSQAQQTSSRISCDESH